MAYVIDRVDLLGYLASDARVRAPPPALSSSASRKRPPTTCARRFPSGEASRSPWRSGNPAATSWSGAEPPYSPTQPPEPRSTPRAGYAGASSKPRDMFSATPRSSAGRPTSWSSEHRTGAARSHGCTRNSHAKATGVGDRTARRAARSSDSLRPSPLSALNQRRRVDHLKDGDAREASVRLLGVGRNAVRVGARVPPGKAASALTVPLELGVGLAASPPGIAGFS